MNRGRTAAMRGAYPWRLAAVLLGWLLAGPAWGQAAKPANPALNRLVRLTPGTRPLGDVLAELSRQGKLPLSYSSSLVPVAHRCYLRPGPARPIGVVLREVLAAEHLSYGLLDGQLVLWPDRAAAPAGVAAVNGRATLADPAVRLAAPVGAAVAAETVAGAKLPAASSTRLASRPGLPTPFHLPGLKPATQARATAASSKGLANNSVASTTGLSHATSTPSALFRHSGRNTYYAPPLPTAGTAKTKQLAAQPLGKTATSISFSSSQPFTHPAGYGRRTAQKAAFTTSQPPANPARRLPQASRQAPESLALLPLLVALPTPTPELGAALPARQVPAELGLAPRNAALSNNSPLADNPRTLADLQRRGYLHGEAWSSESLPLNAAVKIGIPRIYAVLGVATGPFDHQSGGAWGLGVGTVGQPHGRFTFSLDLLHWFMAGDREALRDQHLTQLRPALAWQLKQGGRWQLIGGPTLNLAAAHREAGGPRWALGQDQWLWLNSEEEQSLLRLWPGFQVGVRF